MKLLTTLIFIVLVASCKTKPNTKIQHVSIFHLPKDSLAFYFPINIFSDRPSADSFVQNWYSSALYSFKEPLLSQNFDGYNIYRFLWLRSFHRPVVFTLHQSEGQVWLITKILDKQPSFHDDRYAGVTKESRDEYFKEGFIVDKQNPDLLVRLADRRASIVFNDAIPLSNKEWNEFEELLGEADFWKLPTNIDDGSTDGANWVIEGHLKDKYHVVDYHSPGNSEYGKAGRFLISLSGLRERIY
jgi:hypothetical protein